MASADISPIRIERAMEQLRQEREVFNQRKGQESRWFVLRLTMGYASVVLLCAVIAISAFVLFNSQKFTDLTVKAAGAALFADVLGLLVGVWKIVLKPDFLTKLKAETQEDLDESAGQHRHSQQEQTSHLHEGFQEKFGVLWDENYNMRCLNCKKPLKHSSMEPSIFYCSDPKCDSKHVLKDADGNRITLQESINYLKQGSKDERRS